MPSTKDVQAHYSYQKKSNRGRKTCELVHILTIGNTANVSKQCSVQKMDETMSLI